MKTKMISMLIIFTILSMPITQALSISDISSASEHDSAKITWETDQEATGKVNYGLTKSLGSQSSHVGMSTSHEVSLVGLLPGRKYYYEVISSNVSGYEKKDNNFANYYTLETEDSIPPERVTGLSLKEKGTDFIHIEWQGSSAGDLSKYMIFRDEENIANTTMIDYRDSGLSPDHIYQYSISAIDTSANIGPQSISRQWKTDIIDYTAPEFIDILIDDLGTDFARISLKSTEKVNATLHYGLDSSLEDALHESQYAAEAEFEILNLLDKTTYYYKITICDTGNNCASSKLRNFKTGDDFVAPDITADIPEWHNSNRLDIKGKTEPFSRVRVYVNEDLKRAVDADGEGDFTAYSVSLDTEIDTNHIRIISIDQTGLESFIEKEVRIDTNPPIINITRLEPYLHQESVIMEGFADEEVILSINVMQGTGQMEILPKVTGLRLVEQEPNSVRLTWDEIKDDSLAGYLIYRDGKRMTEYHDNYFIDPALNRSRTYIYEVSAYSTTCTEGPRSEPLTISTRSDAAGLDDDFDEIDDYCQYSRSDYDKVFIKGRFSQSISLMQGENLVIINATDKAGNSVVIEQATTVDTERPAIIEHNLDRLHPSYIPDVTVKGKVAKKDDQKILVTITVNDDESYSALADEEGNFEIDILLQRKIRSDMNEEVDYDPEQRESNYYASYGEGYGASWKNDIKIVAETESGLASEPVESGIILASCGYGSWWSVRLDEPTPNILTPRLMLEGLAQIGIPIHDIKWQGGSVNGTINYVEVSDNVPLNDLDKDRYDLDWVQNIEYIHSSDYKQGYVLIQIKKLDSGNLFIPEGEPESGLTTLDMENYLSDHRKDDDCIIPGFGCIRIPLMIEIDFAHKNGSTYLSHERREVEMTRQKQCIDVEIAIDRRLPSDQLPEEFLRESIAVLNDTITAIDQLLKPLNTIKQVLFYSCAGSIILDYAIAFQESFNCEFSEALNKFNNDKGGNDFKKYYAQTGQCDEYEDEQERMVCQQCETAILARKNFEKTMKYVCDRIFCPSAPTFQKYVRDMTDKYKGTWPPEDEETQDEIYRSDCAFNPKDDFNGSSKYILYDEIYDIYENYKNSKNPEQEEEVDCSGLHPPSKRCCGNEYMEQWGSACLGMDELKQSKCLALEEERVNINSDSDCSAFNRIWNAAAGFCEPDGTAPAEVVPANDVFKSQEAKDLINPGQEENSNEKYIVISSDSSRSVWFRFLPDKYISDVLGNKHDAKNVYPAEIGYITDDVNSVDGNFEPREDSRVSSQRVFRPLTTTLGTDFFYIDVSTSNPNKPEYKDARDAFVKQYIKVVGGKEIKARDVYRQLQERIGFSDKEYIVDPTSGILRSIQCVCLPGITSYLHLWKQIMQAVKICFESVLVTGDGSAGICKAVLSVYVCDLVYDLISCFKQKFGPGFKRETSGGIGNFFGALTSAGEKISNSVEDRYGDSTIWRSIFAEKKLVHSVCLWAFTGTWDFDFTAVLEEDVSIAVETMAMLYPCERRFISFNPATNPSGLTTYNYHLGAGLVAGSRVEYGVDLVCSDDYSCNTPTGECDCVSIGQRTQRIAIGPGKVGRGQVIDEEVYRNIGNAPYRYDKAVLTWRSLDEGVDKSGQVECEIKDVGGDPPAFCQLDLAEGRYRCELDFREENYIRFYNEPRASEREYLPGDPVTVDLRVTQRMPAEEIASGNENNPYTKYLRMQLYNDKGVKITSDAEEKFYAFNFNGMHQMDNLPGYKFSKDDFARSKATIKTDGIPARVNLASESSIPQYNEMLIEFGADKSYEAFNIRDSLKTDEKDKTSIETGKVTSENLIFIDKYKIELRSEPDQGNYLKIHYQNSLLSGDYCTSDLKHWKMHITFYDKSPSAEEPSGQISHYRNEPQQRIIDIPVRCEPLVDTSIPGCIPDEPVITKCICGTHTCNPKDHNTCVYQGGDGRCESIS